MSKGLSPGLTEQQNRAVRTREVSVVLSSGAGCGKTHVLTERYLSHLSHDGAEVGQIVAITFTDRAARQMRGRIRKAIVGHLKEAADDGEADLWARHLRGLESAPISTIHAFCGTLLRQFAVEAGLDPRFAVLEEVLAVNFRSEALVDCFRRLLVGQTKASEDLRQLVLLYGWQQTVSAVASLLPEHDERLWERWTNLPAEEIAGEWIDHAHETVFPRHLRHFVESRPAITRCLDLLRRHPPMTGPMSEPVDILLRETPMLSNADDVLAAIERLREAAKVGRVGSKAWPDSGVYEAIKKAFEDFRKALSGLETEGFIVDLGDLVPAVEVGKRFLRVAAEVSVAYRERKQLHSVVDFHDLLVRARDLLRDHDDVRAQLDEHYRYLLIDELQDTDPVQMELVKALCGGGLASGKLFAVGDHKQSIYRFRGADVTLFQELRRRVPLDGRQGLNVNFRSQPAILDFANALLGQALESYEPLVAHLPQVNPGSCVEFLWSPRPDDGNATESRRIEADWIASRIAAMIGQEMLVVDGQKGGLREVVAGDVVLLFRAMSNVHLYEAALRRHGLNYYLVGGRAFFAQQEIYDLLNLLRALENPQDGLSLAGALRSPFCCLSDEALYVLCQHRTGLWAGLFDERSETLLPSDQVKSVRRARRFMMSWWGLKDRVPIARLLAAVFANSGYDAAMQMEYMGDRKLANLWKLIELARTFDGSGLFGLAEFIARLGDLVESQPREEQAATQPENADVVRLMTIHQAKGLEFPVVILPDLAGQVGASFPRVAEWSPQLGCVARRPVDEDEPPFSELPHRLLRATNEMEEWNEDLRTLYVACTRPRDYLILSATLPPEYRPAGPWMVTLAGRFDLGRGRCLVSDIQPERCPKVRVFDGEHPPPVSRVPASVATGTGMRQFPFPLSDLTLARGDDLVPVEEVLCQLTNDDSLFVGYHGTCKGLPGEQVLRSVLEQWDFTRADGWREHVTRLAARIGLSANERIEVEETLSRLSHSDLMRSLTTARIVRRGVEYLTELPGNDDAGPGVHGMIDCLWQDDKGRWNVLFWVVEAVAASGREAYFREREPALVLAALAVHEQTGNWPRNLAFAFIHDGTVIERSASRLGHRSWLAGISRVAQEIAGSTIDDSAPNGSKEWT
jgi:ATP-dependent helicase/nuclease subunit A